MAGDFTKDNKKAKMEALESDDGLSLPVIKENVVYNQNEKSRSPHKESGTKEERSILLTHLYKFLFKNIKASF